MNSKNGTELPLGLGMALMQNADAFFYFTNLDGQKQDSIIEGSKNIKSRGEMKSYVSSLTASD